MSTFQARCTRAQEAMRRHGIDLLFVAPSSDMTYLMGQRGHLSERLTLLIVPANGTPLAIVPVLEAPGVRPAAAFFSISTWADGSNPYALARSLVGPGSARIAVSDQMWSTHLLHLQQEMPTSVFMPASPLLAPLRQVKDADEIAILRRAGAAADAAFADIVATPLLGLTERQVDKLVREALLKHGHQRAEFSIVGSGPNSGSPHHDLSDRVLQAGDAVVFDFGGLMDNYASDITRTIFLCEPGGQPPDEYRRVYETVRQAQEAAFQVIRPGVACQEIDRAARRVITAAGYGEYFIHRTGHGLGLDGHEEPYMVEGNTLPLQAGMVFSDEPGIYLPGRFGVRIEDIVVVTENGADRLNQAPREMIAL